MLLLYQHFAHCKYIIATGNVKNLTPALNKSSTLTPSVKTSFGEILLLLIK